MDKIEGTFAQNKYCEYFDNIVTINGIAQFPRNRAINPFQADVGTKV